MALDKDTLKTELASMFTSSYTNVDDAAQAWADAYGTYAETGTANGSPPIQDNIAIAKESLKTALLSLFGTSTKASDMASGLDVAFAAFWNTPVNFGASVATVSTGSMSSALQAEFGILDKTHLDAATSIAGILDTFTKAVEVTFTGLPDPVNIV